MALTNPSKQLLTAGAVSVGIGVRIVRSGEIAPIMKTAGFDYLFIDLEHGPCSVESAYTISVGALSAGITPIVRVPAGELALAARCLDGGALGIVMPHVDTPEQAEEVVRALRFAPRGQRSIAGGYPHFGFANRPATDVVRELDEATLIVVMLETPLAIENALRIAQVPGVDILLVGTNDLCLEMGIPGQLTDPRVGAALQKVVAACRRHGKWPGMGGVYSRELLQQYLPLGMRFILAGTDLGLLLGAAQDQAGFIRNTAPAA